MPLVEIQSKTIASGRQEGESELGELRMNVTDRRPDNRERTQRRRRTAESKRRSLKKEWLIPHFLPD